MSQPAALPPRRRRYLLRIVLALAAGTGALVVAGLVVVVPRVERVRDDAIAMVDAHWDHDVAHPGWSFPAHVWSAPASLEGLSPERTAMHARARGYAEACPPVNPGEFCARTGAAIPRGGRFLEGDQPAGIEGWTRPLAFEPVLLGVLVGPDGEVRDHLPLERAPAALTAAILASEDENFRSHWGVDAYGILRAAFANARGGGYRQGASTLTMQVVRNLTQEKDRSVRRKVREMVQAVSIDRHLGKDRVLQMYLDAPYLGQSGSTSICGFQAAAQFYWGVNAEDLTLAEAATLVGILPAPGKFAPDRAPEAAKTHRDRVLKRMGELGWDVTAALAEPVVASPHDPLPPVRFASYLQATRLALETALPPEIAYGAGLDVHTALDVAAQSATEALLDDRVTYLERTTGTRGKGPLMSAVALIDPETGSLVATYDTGRGGTTDFNRATQARRQAGSSFKPLVYALSFGPGPDGKPSHRPDDAVPNSTRVFKGTNGWCPRNVAGRYTATSSFAYGLAESQNIATASVLEESGGPDALVTLASKIGYDTTNFPHEMGLALGQAEVTPLEMARMVATVLGGGRKLSGSPIVAAIDVDGTVRAAGAPPGEQVLTPDAALLTRELMALVVQFGTGGSVHGGGGFPGYEGAIVGKTGTADDEKDLWFIGGTPEYAGAVWLGYDRPVRIGGSASDLAAPLFGWWMRAVHEGLPREKFDDSRLDHRWICTQTGLVPGPNCQGITAPFLKGDAPRGACPGTHAPETGIAMADHISMWEKMELVRLATAQGIAIASDGLPVSAPMGDDGLPKEFVRKPLPEGEATDMGLPIVEP